MALAFGRVCCAYIIEFDPAYIAGCVYSFVSLQIDSCVAMQSRRRGSDERFYETAEKVTAVDCQRTPGVLPIASIYAIMVPVLFRF